jgi:hypothetical protein
MRFINSLFGIPVMFLTMFLTALAISSGSAALSESNQSKQNLPPPPPTNPGSSAAGGRRAPTACPQDQVTDPVLTALSPTDKPGLTLAERPTFLVYVPKSSAERAEFSLRSREGQGIYRTTVSLTNLPNIISFSLPSETPPLEVGKQYTWSVAMICNPNDRIDDQFVTATVQRIELDSSLLEQIQQASPQEQVSLYQNADIWYDAIALLFELRHSQPNDSNIRAAWHDFLQSGGINPRIDQNLEKTR